MDDSAAWFAIMHYVRPVELMTLAAVSKRMYQLALSDVLWERHRDRLIQLLPRIAKFFKRERKPQNVTTRWCAKRPS